MPSVTRSASKEERSSRAVSDEVQPAVDIEEFGLQWIQRLSVKHFEIRWKSSYSHQRAFATQIIACLDDGALPNSDLLMSSTLKNFAYPIFVHVTLYCDTARTLVLFLYTLYCDTARTLVLFSYTLYCDTARTLVFFCTHSVLRHRPDASFFFFIVLNTPPGYYCYFCTRTVLRHRPATSHCIIFFYRRVSHTRVLTVLILFLFFFYRHNFFVFRMAN